MAKVVTKKIKKLTVPLAKLSAPTLPKLVERPQLFREIDQVRQGSPKVLWIQGPPGSGKTTLVASHLRANKLPALWYQLDAGDADVATWFHYLTVGIQHAAPRYRKPMLALEPANLADLPGFTRRFFEQLYSRLKSPGMLVFDNYHDLPAEGPLHVLMVEAFQKIPETILCVVTSRRAPPPVFASLLAQQLMVEFPAEDLFLHVEEVEALLQLHQPRKEDLQPIAQHLQKTTKGWIAGVILLGTHYSDIDPSVLPMEGEADPTVFDYFAQEAFTGLPLTTQTILLKTAMFSAFTGKMAQDMTEIVQAGYELKKLYRARYFVENRKGPQPVFQYHPLFKQFLRQQAVVQFGQERWQALQLRAADVLVQEGEMEEAIELFLDVEQIPVLVPLILQKASDMFQQGRAQTLAAWLARVPDEDLDQHPALRYWQGMSVLLNNPEDSLSTLQKVFIAFQERNDVEGMLLAASGAIYAIEHTWTDLNRLDAWLMTVEALWDKHASSLSREVFAQVIIAMVHGLWWRQPERTVIQDWIDRAEALLVHFDRLNEIPLILHHILYSSCWLGQLDQGIRVLTQVKKRLQGQPLSPSSQIMWVTAQSLACWMRGEFPDSKQHIRQGLDLVERHGLTIYSGPLMTSGLFSALLSRDLEEFEALLAKGMDLSPHLGPAFCSALYCFEGWFHSMQGKHEQGLIVARQAQSFAQQSKSVYAEGGIVLALAHLLLNANRVDEAQALLAEIPRHFLQPTLQYSLDLVRAQAALAHQETTRALEHLRAAFLLGRTHAIFYSTEFWLPDALAQWCALALEHGIEPTYIQHLITAKQLTLDSRQTDSIEWPWPIRISTLDTFQIRTEHGLLTFGRKAPLLPLQMLKVLISLGGHDIPLVQLGDILWPDADGDAAYRSVLTTLARLRKLFDQENVLVVKGGLLSLNFHVCWVDSLAFTQLARAAEGHWNEGNQDRARVVANRAVALYQGSFLSTDDFFPEFSHRRETLDACFQRLSTYMPQS